MEEKKFVRFKKDELSIKEFVMKTIGKGRVSNVSIEYTPVGEKIIISTNKPGLTIGKKGEKIIELTSILKKRFNLENPHIDVDEIMNPSLDAKIVADDIAVTIERMGALKFKAIAYRTLERIMRAGAMGAELRISGKLPSERAKRWRFSKGFLKKTGEPSKVMKKATTVAKTIAGVIGIKVSILPPDAKIHDKIEVNEELKARLIRPEDKKSDKSEKKKDNKAKKMIQEGN